MTFSLPIFEVIGKIATLWIQGTFTVENPQVATLRTFLILGLSEFCLSLWFSIGVNGDMFVHFC